MQPRIIAPVGGHDGPFAAPVRITGQKVLPDWIDYNGHMNVAYYTVAVDQALDRFLEEELGIGARFAAQARMGPYALQANYSYRAELHEGEAFAVTLRLIDHDAKRLHLYAELIAEKDARVAACVETLLMNVDLEARRGAAYPEAVQSRLARMLTCHAALPRPRHLGAIIGIRR